MVPIQGETLTIALPKGRLIGSVREILSAVGVECPAGLGDDRRLLVEDPAGRWRFLVARPVDVPTYVEYGAADLGVVGKDVLLEEQRDVYELYDLGVGECRFVVAAPQERAERALSGRSGTVRVATKFPGVAARYFQHRGIHAEVIKLYGNVELAPLVGLAEVIVDLVSTGQTLKQNGLTAVEEIAKCSARLIANPVSYRIRGPELATLLERVDAFCRERGLQ
ncbi:MAG TPA: ATP phosphoribosyltransferase [Firmicutes bacterium]|jgi:ATP phosphoribosyltransferase|nr:ATP phosphoribosyltransferase [Bacillota bacterium]